jgi:hypothetical protein
MRLFVALICAWRSSTSAIKRVSSPLDFFKSSRRSPVR